MPAPRKHPEETRRLTALHALNILDSEREERFDRLTRLAQRVFKTQAAQVNLIDEDRVWFKSSLGFPGGEAERGTSFCAHAILASRTTVIGDDASRDERFEASEAPAAVNRIEEALRERNATSEEPFELGISIGIAAADPAGEIELWDLTAAADAAMLAAKRAKKASRNGAETAGGRLF